MYKKREGCQMLLVVRFAGKKYKKYDKTLYIWG
jgi:hypothetical protein